MSSNLDNWSRRRSILVVEDEYELCMMLGHRLRSEGYHVDFAHDGPSGLKKAQHILFDLVILDVMLPGESGLDVCLKLRSSGFRSSILFLTARGQTIEKIAGFSAGADDYLTKPFAAAELTARVEALLRRLPPLEPLPESEWIVQYGSLTLNVLRQRAILNGQELVMTPREFKLLSYLAENHDRAISRQELLENVWGNRSSTLTRTVDMHIANLRRLIELDPKEPELIVTLPGTGYRFQIK